MYRLYVKWPKQKTFRPVNWREGVQVRNLIHATLFTAEESVKLTDELISNAGMNPGMEWELRPCS